MKFIGQAKRLISLVLGRERAVYPVEASERDMQCLQLCIPFTMTSIERLYATLSSVKYVVNNRVPGAFVECGVWRGGSSMVMAKTLIDLNEVERELYLFDTFEGMTEPTELDRDSSGRTAKSQLDRSEKKEGGGIWCVASIEDVRSNLLSTGYPEERLHLIKGDVAKTLRDRSKIPEEISLLRLDTDWYESTKIELEALFPRLVKGGVCLIDDYGHWQGSRKALDEYLAEQQLFPLIHVTDYTGRAFIKN